MSRKFDMISIFLMVVLIVILFFVIFGYFNGSSILTSSEGSNIQNTNLIGSGDDSTSIISNSYKNSGESPIIPIINSNSTKESGDDIIVSGESLMSGEISNGEEHIVSDKNETPGATNTQTVPSTTSNPLILSSDSNISSREKKEVLKELDQTLMELLEVVDSVKTVDETRLITDESGVQP
ncbi:MAG: hypothetical protein IJ215_05895 [Clostridia bacterium]|nr:hypothetical protein [Clostridia bacterium]